MGCALSRLAGPVSVFWASGSELECPSVWSLFRGSLGVGLRLPGLPRNVSVDSGPVRGPSAPRSRSDNAARGPPVGYLVDPASSHMLVSKTKPCMCKYKRLNRETANGSLNQL